MQKITNNMGKVIYLLEEEEYLELQEQSNWLTCLENAGVDNWDGCSFARELYREDFPEEE